MRRGIDLGCDSNRSTQTCLPGKYRVIHKASVNNKGLSGVRLCARTLTGINIHRFLQAHAGIMKISVNSFCVPQGGVIIFEPGIRSLPLLDCDLALPRLITVVVKPVLCRIKATTPGGSLWDYAATAWLYHICCVVPLNFQIIVLSENVLTQTQTPTRS